MKALFTFALASWIVPFIYVSFHVDMRRDDGTFDWKNVGLDVIAVMLASGLLTWLLLHP